MGGGLMQLVAYGAQDIYLTGNPQITFFKVVYRRHTNFSMESIQQTWSGTAKADAASRVTATISRNGDLVHKLYLETKGLGVAAYANPGAVLIDDVTVEIGGQTIDKHYGHWMEAWAELTEHNPSGQGSSAVSGEKGTTFQRMSAMGGVNNSKLTDKKTFIPLRFWFCENPGLALPLIALQYHEVKIILNTAAPGALTGGDVVLWADYIYLDTDERRRFAQVSHEYLITQVQHQSFSNKATMDLNFNHPVKELVWTSAWATGLFTPSLTRGNNFLLKLNGHDRFAARDRDYFTLAQVWQHHSGFGSHGAANNTHDHSIAVYSFALKPEEHQPSGTCNFSRIDNAQLIQSGGQESVNANTGNVQNVYAVNYNVLRIMSGMGGLAYSN